MLQRRNFISGSNIIWMRRPSSDTWLGRLSVSNQRVSEPPRERANGWRWSLRRRRRSPPPPPSDVGEEETETRCLCCCCYCRRGGLFKEAADASQVGRTALQDGPTISGAAPTPPPGRAKGTSTRTTDNKNKIRVKKQKKTTKMTRPRKPAAAFAAHTSPVLSKVVTATSIFDWPFSSGSIKSKKVKHEEKIAVKYDLRRRKKTIHPPAKEAGRVAVNRPANGFLHRCHHSEKDIIYWTGVLSNKPSGTWGRNGRWMCPQWAHHGLSMWVLL